MELHYVPLTEFERVREMTSLSIYERAAIFANLCRINILYMITRAGSGHLGTSFSSVDIIAWLFLNELRISQDDNPERPGDIYFSSKGHDAPALYSVLVAMKLLPFNLIHQLRRKDGLPGHPDNSVPYLVTNTGSLGMGISKAKGMVLANRLQGRSGNIYVLSGDGELQEGQFWESLISAANGKMSEITLIVDHNKLQSDTFVSRVSDLGDLPGKLHSFGWHVERCSGHDLKSFERALDDLRDITNSPKAIIADTIKGRGVSFMEHTSLRPEDKLYRYHSGAPDDATYQRAATELISDVAERLTEREQQPLRLESEPRPSRTAPANPQRLITAYGRELTKQAEKNDRVVVFDADLVLDCGLIPFQEQFPDRFIECGIAEQDMVSQAGAMALRGLLPVVHSFACFLSSRPNEQIYNNATERTKVLYVGSLAGILPGGPGHSHQSVRDISALAAVPGLILLEPCTEAQVAQAVDFCINGTRESCYLRLVSIPCDVPFEDLPGASFELGQGSIVLEGTDGVIFGYGPVLLSEAYRAAQLLRQRQGMTLRVINFPWLNRFDREWLRSAVAGMPWVFTLDNHYSIGGQGSMLLRELAETDDLDHFRARSFGVTKIPVCGTNEEVLRAHQLDAESLAQRIGAETSR
jgi:transketolase